MWAFLEGMGRLLDIFGVFSDPRDHFIQDDAEATRSDWRAVGFDMRTAMDNYTKE